MRRITEARSRSGWRGTWRCALESLLRRCPDVRYVGPDPVNYGLVVLIAPIWIYQLAGPMRSFVRGRHESLRRVAVISTMGSRGAVNAQREIASMLGVTPELSAAFTARDVDDGSYATRLLGIEQALRASALPSTPTRAAQWSPVEV